MIKQINILANKNIKSTYKMIMYNKLVLNYEVKFSKRIHINCYKKHKTV